MQDLVVDCGRSDFTDVAHRSGVWGLLFEGERKVIGVWEGSHNELEYN